MKKKISKKEVLYLENEEMFKLFEKIQKKEYKTMKVLKDSSRSYVILIEIDGEYFVYKQPREKNTRKWQRFLSIFRGSEAYREASQMQEAKNYGFLCPKVQYAYEKRKGKIVIDSHLVYSYIEGYEATYKEANRVLEYLQKIHQAGFLHGDSQIYNFIIQEEKIFMIDFKFCKNRYGALGEAYEIYYLELSCPQATLFVNRKRISYKIAKFWKDIKELWTKQKTKRREKK